MIQFVLRLIKWREIAVMILTLVASLFKILALPRSSELLLIGLSTLASAYFISAYSVHSRKAVEDKMKFSDLLVSIVRKMMFIGLSVLCVGYLFAILYLDGANEMMIIGLLTLVICLILSMALILMKRERMAMLRSPIVRSAIGLLLYFVTPLLR